MSSPPTTIPDLVRQRAAVDGDRVAFTYLADGAGDAQSISWSQLNRRALELAAQWQAHGVSGRPVLLALPSGLRFVESLVACWYSGAIPVPVSLPRHARVKHRLDGIVSDCGATFIIASEETRRLLTSQDACFKDLTWLDPLAPESPAQDVPPIAQSLALLQYTSGSTGSPRGVIVTHANLMQNSALIANACGHAPGQTIGGWLPMFHDMGLIGLLIQAAFSGARCVFMSPDRFLMRPWLWLKMISDYDICSSPAPNFAYDLCVDKITDEHKAKLNLSGWRNALNGSEPVRTRTLDRFANAFESCGFSRAAFFPCYGLAEATLLVTGPIAPCGPIVRYIVDQSNRVSCGQPMGDTRLAIVDPQTLRRVAPQETGEIWIRGASCASGYWKDKAGTDSIFNAQIQGEGSETWLRTGDLGYIANEQIFITGRIRELIIIAGRNLFPVDLEQTVEKVHALIAPGGVAAFSIEADNLERLAIAVELRRDAFKAPASEIAAALDLPLMRRQISAAVAAEHGVTPLDVVLLRAGTLPRTTSGKIRRGAVRANYLSGVLNPTANSTDSSSDVACTQ